MLHVLMNHMKLHDTHTYSKLQWTFISKLDCWQEMLTTSSQLLWLPTLSTTPLDIDGSPSINSLTRTLTFLVSQKISHVLLSLHLPRCTGSQFSLPPSSVSTFHLQSTKSPVLNLSFHPPFWFKRKNVYGFNGYQLSGFAMSDTGFWIMEKKSRFPYFYNYISGYKP